MKDSRHNSNPKGFTVMELLIVIAVIAILAAICIPVFSAQLEKSRRAVDISLARQIEAALVIAYNNGDIEIPEKSNNSGYGAWVMICNGWDNAPKPYRSGNPFRKQEDKEIWCGANEGIAVNGNTQPSDGRYNNELEKIIADTGLNIEALKTCSNGGEGGWDWIIVQIGYDKNKKFFARMYSGYSKDDGGANLTGKSNLERLLYD